MCRYHSTKSPCRFPLNPSEPPPKVARRSNEIILQTCFGQAAVAGVAKTITADQLTLSALPPNKSIGGNLNASVASSCDGPATRCYIHRRSAYGGSAWRRCTPPFLDMRHKGCCSIRIDNPPCRSSPRATDYSCYWSARPGRSPVAPRLLYQRLPR